MTAVRKPDRRAVIILGCWLALLAAFVSSGPAGRGNPTPLLLARPVDALCAVALAPAHPLLIPSAIGAPLNLALTAAGMTDRTYFRLARLCAIPGWLTILGLAGLSGYRRVRLLFYVVLAGLSLLLAVTYGTAFGIHT
jgi:hypothetical protein